MTRMAGNKAGPLENGKDPEHAVVLAPIPGLLSRFTVNPGDDVSKGDIVAIIESMKTESHILAASKGRIGVIRTQAGQQVRLNQVIMEIEIN